MKNALLYLSLLAASLFSFALSAQETRMFVPNEIRQAYENGTRAYNGKPGPKYWQNTVDYTIAVAVDPVSKSLRGEETVVYYNNSPDALNTLVLRLYNDAFRSNSARLYDINADGVMEGVEITEITLDGQPFDVKEGQRSGTLFTLALPEPLKAGARLTVRLKWSTHMPDTHIRAGVSDSTAFFVAYWYPQVSVYDDVFGWDELPYNLQGEFYNNLANFDVTITAPEDFLVWATGELQNAEAVYPATVLERWRQAHTSAKPTMIVSVDELTAGYRNRSGTWRYKAAEVSDFAFALSDHYAWEAGAQQVADRHVLVSSVYPLERAKECAGLTALQQKTMKTFSENMPGIPYPYPVFTTFIGTFGGGMEFPMMANNDAPRQGVTVHEMFHTYFPMYVRINEKRFAWMDEGWASFGTDVVRKRYFQKSDVPFYGPGRDAMQGNTGSLSDLPLITSTQFMDGGNYGYASYPLPAFIYATLHHHLGDALFMQCFQEYIRRWAKKSPTPYDFFYTFENVSGQDLAWLWKPWFFEYGYPDAAIKSLKGNKLVVEKRGTRPTPLHVLIQYKNGKTQHVYAGANAWQKKNGYTVNIPQDGPIEMIQVNPDIPDRTELDNYYPPLTEFYKGVTLPADLAGVYTVAEFQVNVFLDWKNGLILLRVPEAGQSVYLIPKSNTVLESVDGQVKLELTSPQGPTTSFKLKDFGYDVVAKRL